MSLSLRRSASWWIITLLCACGFSAWATYQRAQRVMRVSKAGSESAIVDHASSTGYAGGRRWLIVPEHNHRSYQWIAETQQMFARGEWRVRHVDYENAPSGREVHAASPYRWWLGLIAWIDHALSGRPLGLSVERAALWADPLLHLLLLVGTTVFVARSFGSFAAALCAAGLALLYPFAGGFLPGVPDDRGAARALALWSVLPLVAGLVQLHGGSLSAPGLSGAADRTRTFRHIRRLFVIAGTAGGLGLWIGPVQQSWVLAGLALGALAAALNCRRQVPGQVDETSPVAPWRTWALAGAVTSILGYFVEYFPSNMGLRLEVNHPIHAVVWIGVGELLVQVETWLTIGRSFWTWRRAAALIAAGAAIASLPVILALGKIQPWLTLDRLAGRLSFLPDGVVATSFAAWIQREGLTGPIAATCAPLLLLVPASWLLWHRSERIGQRAGIALALGPILATLIVAFNQLASWSVLDALLLVLFVVAVSSFPPAQLTHTRHWIWTGCATLALLPGALQLLPPPSRGKDFSLTRLEIEGLIERNLAHWIADRAGPDGAVILAPPDRTSRWCYHGGFRGLGSANWENRDGLRTTIEIVNATSIDEAQVLINEHGVTHIILPSWDTDLDEFARRTLQNPDAAFIATLHRWALPPWLRPLPYKLPVEVGFDRESVVVLQVTDDSNRPASVARVAEYFVESGKMDYVASAVQALQAYPTDLGALAALAQLEKARGNPDGFTRTLNTILSSLSAGSDRALAWDRRVSLAIALAQGERNDLARDQVRRCLEKLDEEKLRSLTTGALYRLLALSKSYGLPIADPTLHERAFRLLPVELYRRLVPESPGDSQSGSTSG